MPQPKHLTRLDLPQGEPTEEDLKKDRAKCVEKLGTGAERDPRRPSNPKRARTFIAMYNELMLVTRA